MTPHHKPSAILLMGPTGSGKTPLGDLLAREGLGETACFHFDFGEALRKAASKQEFHTLLTDEDIRYIHKVLNEGALLENETFYIAQNILGVFMSTYHMGGDDLLVLNGLPRHIDQARDMARQVNIHRVVYLECTPETVVERIRLNTGGDRSHRDDDDLHEIRGKLATFTKRTLPLIDFFQRHNAIIQTLSVGIDTTARTMLDHLKKKATL